MYKYTIIGTASLSFTTKDEKQINGTTIYVTCPIERNGQGVAAEKMFISAAKLATMSFTPTVGQEIEIFYDK